MSDTKRSLFVDAVIIVALVSIAVLGYLFSPLLLPKADVALAPLAGCDLNQQACRAEMPEGGAYIELAIAPQPIPVVRPLQITVALPGLPADKVEVDFAGVTMNMGVNRVTLTPAGADKFTGETTIPVCVTGRMLWRATVMVETGHQRIAAPFQFEAPVNR
ncbi:MAG: hypothetical protein LBP94_02790 [Zoogloeaceae bacterium]|jgi:hypothetical protein|nr:hypothetical protein [Zoogloeaceae bacterium]